MVVGRVFWRGALSEIEDRVGPVAGARLTRGARPHPARGGVQDPGRSAVRLQARADPRRRLRDASRAPPAAPSMRAVARFLEATTDVGQSHEALGHHWRRRARATAHSSTSSPPPTRRAVAGRSSGRSLSTARRSSSSPTTTRDGATSRGSSPWHYRPCTTSATSEASGGWARLDGVFGEREVGRRDVARDLVDRRHHVVAEPARRARGPSPRSAPRRCRTTSGRRRCRRRRGCAPRRSRDSGSARSPWSASRRSGGRPCRPCTFARSGSAAYGTA